MEFLGREARQVINIAIISKCSAEFRCWCTLGNTRVTWDSRDVLRGL